MNIIFQSGDFYNETSSFWSYYGSIITALCGIIAVLLGALINGRIAISIFKKGLKKEVEKKRNETISEYNLLEQYFFHNIDALKFFIDNQIDEIFKCSSKTKDWTQKHYLLKIFPELTTRDIWEINKQKLYDIFVSNRVGELKSKAYDFINLRNSLYNIDNFIETQNELNKEVFKRMFVNMELWNHGLQALLNLSNSFVIDHNLNSPTEKDFFLKFFTDLMVTRQRELVENNVIENIKFDYKELIEPLKRYLKENHNINDRRVYLVSEQLLNIEKAYIELKSLRHEYRKNVLLAGRKLIKIKSALSLCVSNIEKRQKINK